MIDPIHAASTAAAAPTGTTSGTAAVPPSVHRGYPPADASVVLPKPGREYGHDEPVVAELVGGPALTAEQEIRSRALDCAVGIYCGALEVGVDPEPTVAEVLDAASVFESWIRDGDDGITEAQLGDEPQP